MYDTWQLIWQDQFDADELDPSKWQVQIGYTGASNKELQIYTNLQENIHLENSCLVFTALKKPFLGHLFTSARVATRGLFTCQYGRLEASIRIPTGKGMWPAFWMLGDDIGSVGWPKCGEIDIMENKGGFPDVVRGTIHGPAYSGDESIGKDYCTPGRSFSDAFHLYAIEWEPHEIRWYVDDFHYNTLTDKDVHGDWVFDHPFYIVLNLAIGGSWPGFPDDTTQFPQRMVTDYVKVYSRRASAKVF